MAQAEKLYQLQALDWQLEADQKRTQEIEADLGETETLLQARSNLQATQAECRRWATQTRDLELDLGSVNNEIKSTEGRLYSGRVTNPKELNDLQQKAAALKRHRQTLEDELLETMVQGEEAQDELESRQASLEQIEQDWQMSQASLKQELADLKEHIAKNETERLAMRQAIPDADLQIYDEVRERKGTVAVAQLKDGVCGFCAVSPSSQHLKHLRRAESIMFCANCGRILFMP
jgi:predicted  nucleic acid-binding Zn-ribbon protein